MCSKSMSSRREKLSNIEYDKRISEKWGVDNGSVEYILDLYFDYMVT